MQSSELVALLSARRSLAGAEELSRLGIAIKQACCSALGSAVFDMLGQMKLEVRNYKLEIMRLSIKLNVWKFRIFVMMSFILFERKKN